MILSRQDFVFSMATLATLSNPEQRLAVHIMKSTPMELIIVRPATDRYLAWTHSNAGYGDGSAECSFKGLNFRLKKNQKSGCFPEFKIFDQTPKKSDDLDKNTTEDHPKSVAVWGGMLWDSQTDPASPTKSLEGFVGQANLKTLHRSDESLHISATRRGPGRLPHGHGKSWRTVGFMEDNTK